MTRPADLWRGDIRFFPQGFHDYRIIRIEICENHNHLLHPRSILSSNLVYQIQSSIDPVYPVFCVLFGSSFTSDGSAAHVTMSSLHQHHFVNLASPALLDPGKVDSGADSPACLVSAVPEEVVMPGLFVCIQ